MPYADPEARREARRRYERAHRAERRRDRHKSRTKADNARRMAAKRNEARLSTTFAGVDGEGWTDPATGRHHYMMLVAGDRHLYTGEPLTAVQCLAFLSRLRDTKGHYFVSFFFDYDVTMILRDLVLDDPEKAAWLVSPDRPFAEPVEWRGFLLDYLPKKHFRVRSPGYGWVTIHDTRAFFQCSFHKAITDFRIGTKRERDRIGRMKAKRSSFDARQADRILRYCQDECRLLARLIGKLRDRFAEVGMSAHPFEGPGPVAGRTLTAKVGRQVEHEYRTMLPAGVVDFAQRAYYGGRFETTAVGRVHEPVYGYDLHSAYPAAMRELPCLDHGRWLEGVESPLYVAHVSWQHPDWPNYRPGNPAPERLPWRLMGPLPHRIRKTGAIVYPLGGEGWYWSPEIPPYAEVKQAFSYVRDCDCQPFRWVEQFYNRRAELEAEQKGSGIALKLTLNSLYGKLAQRIGSAPHYNPIWAGLITALTRAKIYQVYLDHPATVVMMATDAVFLTEPAPELPISPKLGEWEAENDGEPYREFVVFRPGIYFDSGVAKFKTRGVPKREFQERAEEFELACLAWLPGSDLKVELLRENHVSIRAGLNFATNHHTNEINHESEWLKAIGDWRPNNRSMTPDPRPKRLGEVDLLGLDVEQATHWTPALPNLGTPTHPYQYEDEQPWDESAADAARWDDGTYDGDVG